MEKKAVRAIPEWGKEFAEKFPPGNLSGSIRTTPERLEKYIHALLTTREAEAYKQGQMNPKVEYMRQFLNESGKYEKMWTNEDILIFLRIPFTTNSKETTKHQPNK